MSQQGYIYILIRGDFIENKQYIYKIGQTTRFPPHKRLWDYPYGSLFISLFPCNSPIKLEKIIKKELNASNEITCKKEIGVEYFEGNLQNIINIIAKLHVPFKPKNVQTATICSNINSYDVMKLNRVHYIVNYDQKYFDFVFKHNFYIFKENDNIPTEQIYASYQKARQWFPNLPDNYVIRHGLISIPPSKSIFYMHNKKN